MTQPHAPSDQATTAAIQSHPRGLYVLFVTEMWERFCYYGMRALLVLYMVNYFKWTPGSASKIYKWYTALVYLTPLAGGYLADRVLGNKRAVVIGAIMMSVGEFCLVFDTVPLFYLGLGLLILGNGMFKPNMSTQVGRLYPQNDPRRDAAYTIFYMGINVGAFLAPIVCGYLRENYGYRYGFAAAGVGMLFALVAYLVGLPLVKELEGRTSAVAIEGERPEPEDAPSAVPTLNRAAPAFVAGLGLICIPLGALLYLRRALAADNLIIVGITTFVFLAAAWILSKTRGSARDRVMAIYGVAAFVVFFWAAFEQAGNAMNLWADQVTDRYVTAVAPPPSIFPAAAPPVGFEEAAGAVAGAQWHFGGDAIALLCVAALAFALLIEKVVRRRKWNLVALTADLGAIVGGLFGALARANPEWWHRLWNPVSTEWFQSINAIAIVVLAPLFAWFWVRHGKNINIPTKMALGIGAMSLAFGVMVLSARSENGSSRAPLSRLPAEFRVGSDETLVFSDAPEYSLDGNIERGEDAVPAQGGRMRFENGVLELRGVLADVDRERMLRATAPESFVRKVMELARLSQSQTSDRFVVEVTLDEPPPGLDLRYAGFDPRNIRYDSATHKLVDQNLKLRDKDYKALLVAGADPAFRAALDQLYVHSARYKVSTWWLIWFYVLSTFGELCLSPVGLSMVSKLAPARFATMLMGMWLLTSFYGNFAAGAAGESWGAVSPTSYFFTLVLVIGLASAALFAMVRLLNKMMHGVK